MSRLIVKNLPGYVTPERLKEHFSQKNGPGGLLTDVKVALKSDGTSRRFGFVGFKDEQDALRAQQWYDRTFIGTTRINVAVAGVSFSSCCSSPVLTPSLERSEGGSYSASQ